ncbi:putative addiction module antidote protein [Desulfobulbus sp. TB]|nr:putative addiction module antidote protein [Desulfobulbus sp. TB]
MMTEVAGKAGLNRESLYKALAGEGNPRFSTVNRVIKALGMPTGCCVKAKTR